MLHLQNHFDSPTFKIFPDILWHIEQQGLEEEHVANPLVVLVVGKFDVIFVFIT